MLGLQLALSQEEMIMGKTCVGRKGPFIHTSLGGGGVGGVKTALGRDPTEHLKLGFWYCFHTSFL